MSVIAGPCSRCLSIINFFNGIPEDHLCRSNISLPERRELAKQVLLKLIEISPAHMTLDKKNEFNGAALSWEIADAFFRAEPK